MEFLKGYRTYILGVLALITIVSAYFGVIDTDSANTLLSVFGFGGLLTLRAALK